MSRADILQFPDPHPQVSRLGTHDAASDDCDPLLVRQEFPYSATYSALGFAVRVEANAPEILIAAAESWGMQAAESTTPTVTVRLGMQQQGKALGLPVAPTVRVSGHLLSMIADGHNFALCDLRQSYAFGWLSPSAVRNRLYLRYHFLEAAALTLLSTSQMTPVHAACVSLDGCGFLLCGDSGAGKSTLAYACARAGWTYTSDDASYLLWRGGRGRVRGNANQVRFRPSAQQLFPEINGRPVTPRAEGKPSIEVPTAELPRIVTSQDASVDFVIRLNRRATGPTALTPLTPIDVLPYFERSLYPLEEIRRQQADAIRGLLQAQIFALQYSDLDKAVECLTQLARGPAAS